MSNIFSGLFQSKHKKEVIVKDFHIEEFYSHDHDDLDGYLKEFQRLKRVDFMKAKPFFRSFKFGLQRHILWEEEILFPFFEQKTGMKDGGPTAVMRHEHVLIKQALESLHAKVRNADPDSEAEEKELIGLLSEHNMKEEHILYPAIDKLASLEEKAQMNKQMASVDKDRYEFCGCRH